MPLPDISEYYRKEQNAAAEEKAWNEAKRYVKHAASVAKALKLFGGRSVLEVACGSGWVPAMLPKNVAYTGVDKLSTFIELARGKNKDGDRTFVCGDLREVLPTLGSFDLVCSFATIKHFGLHEWSDIVRRLLEKAAAGVLELPISDSDYDNGTEFHHIFVTKDHASRAIGAAGHEVVATEVFCEGIAVDKDAPGGKRPITEVTYFTRRRAAPAAQGTGA